MCKYFIKCLLSMIPTFLLASVLVFSLMHLMPGAPAAVMLGDTATPEQVQALRRHPGCRFFSPCTSHTLSSITQSSARTPKFTGSPRSVATQRMPEAGITKVTVEVLVGPALANSRKWTMRRKRYDGSPAAVSVLTRRRVPRSFPEVVRGPRGGRRR